MPASTEILAPVTALLLLTCGTANTVLCGCTDAGTARRGGRAECHSGMVLCRTPDYSQLATDPMEQNRGAIYAVFSLLTGVDYPDFARSHAGVDRVTCVGTWP